MKRFTRIVSVVGLLSVLQIVSADSITDAYNTGDTLTTTTLDNIKSAVNDNDTRIDALEAVDVDTRITALENALAAHIANLANPHSVTKAQVGLADVENIQVNFSATVPPTAFDDVDYSIGSLWIDITQQQAYVLIDNTESSAVWKRITNTYDIGQPGPAGGIVFYVTPDGLHGLEAAPADQGGVPLWGCFGTLLLDPNDDAIGKGAENTANIVAGCADPGIAAEIANTYSEGGYSDWFLPSISELSELYSLHLLQGGFVNGFYWSSSENNDIEAVAIDFSDGSQTQVDKSLPLNVRPIRVF